MDSVYGGRAGVPSEDSLAGDSVNQVTSVDGDHDFDAALQAMVEAGLLADADVITDIIRDDAPTPDGLTPQSPEELSLQRELDEKIGEIYRAIVERAPEHKVQPSLERVRMCLDLMGNPHHSFRAIHITGTNGKTSTARMCEALIRERGLRTGRFTSPHLSNVRERISIDGMAISREDFITAWDDVAPFVDMTDAHSLSEGGPRMSFFEVFVVMAYAAFAAAPIDVAIVEVGMGGRWDATNVIDADVAVIMPIGLDHEKWLGSSLDDIAEEKLGIVKAGCTLVSAQQSPDVAERIRAHARSLGVRLVEYGNGLSLMSRESAVGGQMINVQTPAARYEGIPLSLRGKHQAENAAVALAAVEAFFDGSALAGDVVEHSLMSVSSPGRLEVVRTSPTIILDACHNPHGAAATADALDEYFPGNKVGVFAMMADKDIEGVLGIFEPVFDAIVITSMATERAAHPEDIAEIARRIFSDERVCVDEDLTSAIDTAVSLAESENDEALTSPAVVICGSIQLIGAARDILGVNPPDGA